MYLHATFLNGDVATHFRKTKLKLKKEYIFKSERLGFRDWTEYNFKLGSLIVQMLFFAIIMGLYFNYSYKKQFEKKSK